MTQGDDIEPEVSHRTMSLSKNNNPAISGIEAIRIYREDIMAIAGSIAILRSAQPVSKSDQPRTGNRAENSRNAMPLSQSRSTRPGPVSARLSADSGEKWIQGLGHRRGLILGRKCPASGIIRAGARNRLGQANAETRFRTH